MKLSEYKDAEALDLLADLIEPATAIFGDPEVQKVMKSGKTRAAAVACVIRLHKEEVMEILAVLDGTPVSEYHCNVLTLPLKLLELINDPEVMRLFSSAGQIATASGSHMENTGADEQ